MLMEIKIRRRRPSRGRRGMAGMAGPLFPSAAEQKTQAAEREKFFAKLRAQHAANRARALSMFSKSITFAEYAAEMKVQAGVAVSLNELARRHASLLPTQRTEIAGLAGEVTELWRVATAQAAKTPGARITPKTAAVRVTRLYEWMGKVSGQVQAAMKAPKVIDEVANYTTNLPGNVMGWAVEQLKQPLAAFGIPPWVLPVAGGLLLLGLAAPLLGPAVSGLGSLARASRGKA